MAISLEDDAAIPVTVDLSALDTDTDDQTVDGLSIIAGVVNLSLEDDSVAPVTLDMISIDANNDIATGTDGALYLNVASVVIAETNTTLGFNGATNELTYTNELGNNPVLDLSSIDTDTDDQQVDTFSFICIGTRIIHALSTNIHPGGHSGALSSYPLRLG